MPCVDCLWYVEYAPCLPRRLNTDKLNSLFAYPIIPVPARHFRIVRVSKHLVHIEGKGLQLYVFCQKYREARMRQQSGAFEIYFVHAYGTFPLPSPFRPAVSTEVP